MPKDVRLSLPPLPDFVGVGSLFLKFQWPQKSEWWCKPPDRFFTHPRKAEPSSQAAYEHYYMSALFLAFCCYAIVGMILTWIRNKVVESATVHGTYKKLNHGLQDVEEPSGRLSVGDHLAEHRRSQSSGLLEEQRLSEYSDESRGSPRGSYRDLTDVKHASHGTIQPLLKGRCLIGIVVSIWFALYAWAIPQLVSRGVIEFDNVFSGEAWFIWVNLHCVFGLLSTLVSIKQPEKKKLQLHTYPMTMFMTSNPFSEKFDSVRDCIMASLAIHDDDIILQAIGYCIFAILFFAHIDFVYTSSTRSVLLENYLPVLVAEPQKERGRVAKQSTFEQYAGKAKLAASKFLLKQSGEAKRRITLREDLPQTILIVFLQFHRGGGFLVFSLIVTLCKLIMSQVFTRLIHTWLASTIRIEREKAYKARNIPKVINLSKAIWEFVDPYDEAPELKLLEITAEDLLEEDVTFKQLCIAGYNLKEKGQKIEDLIVVGVDSAKLFKTAGFSPDEIGKYFTATQMYEAGFAAWEIKNCFDLTQLKEAKFPVYQLKEAGYGVTQLEDVGFNAKQVDAEFSDEELKMGKFTTEQLREANVDGERMKRLGFTAKALLDAKYRGVAIKDNFSVSELVKEELSLNQVICDVGYNDADDFSDCLVVVNPDARDRFAKIVKEAHDSWAITMVFSSDDVSEVEVLIAARFDASSCFKVPAEYLLLRPKLL